MLRTLSGTAVAALAALTATGCGGPTDTATRTVTVESSPPPPPTAAEPDPHARWDTTCNYLLGDLTEGPQGMRFVADAVVRNTGNVGIILELRASWKQAGAAPVTTTKRVRVPHGGSRDVGATVTATQSMIEAHQAATEPRCKVTFTLAGTFGAPR